MIRLALAFLVSVSVYGSCAEEILMAEAKGSQVIECQAPHDSGGGCTHCGGYGFVFHKVPVCEKCHVEAWVRPGAWTIYEGKTWRTVDGLLVVHVGLDKRLCGKCAKEEI